MSELVLRESSDNEISNVTSSDDELNLIKRESSNYHFKKIIKSTENVDKRLID